MRALKFRAWHEGAQEYLKGSTSNKFRWIEENQPIVLEQFTGLKDKNGVEIYEGDVCRMIILVGENKEWQGNLYKIIWLRSAWGFEPLFPEIVNEDDAAPKSFYVDPFEGDDWPTDTYFEVIGNIHENPELLKP